MRSPYYPCVNCQVSQCSNLPLFRYVIGRGRRCYSQGGFRFANFLIDVLTLFALMFWLWLVIFVFADLFRRGLHCSRSRRLASRKSGRLPTRLSFEFRYRGELKTKTRLRSSSFRTNQRSIRHWDFHSFRDFTYFDRPQSWLKFLHIGLLSQPTRQAGGLSPRIRDGMIPQCLGDPGSVALTLRFSMSHMRRILDLPLVVFGFISRRDVAFDADWPFLPSVCSFGGRW